MNHDVPPPESPEWPHATAVHNGLAIYLAGDGLPLLLVPSPHGLVLGPTAAGALYRLLSDLGFSVVTFDPPGAFQSSRAPRLDLQEMTECCVESLAFLGVTCPVPVIGHSQVTLCALQLVLEHPEQVSRLLLIGAVDGGACVTRDARGLPYSLAFWDPMFWRIAWNGTRLSAGGNLRAHRRLLGAAQQLSFANPTLVPKVSTAPEDRRWPAPVRDRWPRSIRHVDLRERLDAVAVPALICVGRHDPQTTVASNRAIANALPSGELVVFQDSGHYPFIEEAHRFAEVVLPFLSRR